MALGSLRVTLGAIVVALGGSRGRRRGEIGAGGSGVRHCGDGRWQSVGVDEQASFGCDGEAVFARGGWWY